MSRVLVTGANGFVGSNLCRWLRGRGWEVDALVRESSDLHFLEGLDVKLIKGDLRFSDRIDLPAGTTHIVHAASIVSDTANDEDCSRNIFDMTWSLVRRIRAAGLPLQRFVYISSALTIGFARRDISEERRGQPAAFVPYVRHKIRTENLLRDQHAVHRSPWSSFGPATCSGRTTVSPRSKSSRARSRAFRSLPGEAVGALATAMWETSVRPWSWPSSRRGSRAGPTL